MQKHSKKLNIRIFRQYIFPATKQNIVGNISYLVNAIDILKHVSSDIQKHYFIIKIQSCNVVQTPKRSKKTQTKPHKNNRI